MAYKESCHNIDQGMDLAFYLKLSTGLLIELFVLRTVTYVSSQVLAKVEPIYINIC